MKKNKFLNNSKFELEVLHVLRFSKGDEYGMSLFCHICSIDIMSSKWM
jgi:hypothetical protein